VHPRKEEKEISVFRTVGAMETAPPESALKLTKKELVRTQQKDSERRNRSVSATETFGQPELVRGTRRRGNMEGRTIRFCVLRQ
jgi:hypothetical protein